KIDELAANVRGGLAEEVLAALQGDWSEASVKPQDDFLNNKIRLLPAPYLLVTPQHRHDEIVNALAATTNQVVKRGGIAGLDPVDRNLNPNGFRRGFVQTNYPIAPKANTSGSRVRGDASPMHLATSSYSRAF